MAKFSHNEELARQQVRIAPDQARGFKKHAMAALGYKATGERNAYGKIIGYVPGVSTQQHFMARAIAGKADKSDYAATLKAGDQAAANKLVKDVGFVAEAAKLAGGGAGAGGVATKAMGGGNGAMTQAVGGKGGGNLNLFNNIAGGELNPNFDPEALKRTLEEKENYNKRSLQGEKDSIDQEVQDEFMSESDDTASSDGMSLDKGIGLADDLVGGTQVAEGTDAEKNVNTIQKVGQLGSNVPVAGAVIGAGAESVAAGVAYNSALEEKNKEFQNKKKALSDDSLWM